MAIAVHLQQDQTPIQGAENERNDTVPPSLILQMRKQGNFHEVFKENLSATRNKQNQFFEFRTWIAEQFKSILLPLDTDSVTIILPNATKSIQDDKVALVSGNTKRKKIHEIVQECSKLYSTLKKRMTDFVFMILMYLFMFVGKCLSPPTEKKTAILRQILDESTKKERILSKKPLSNKSLHAYAQLIGHIRATIGIQIPSLYFALDPIRRKINVPRNHELKLTETKTPIFNYENATQSYLKSATEDCHCTTNRSENPELTQLSKKANNTQAAQFTRSTQSSANRSQQSNMDELYARAAARELQELIYNLSREMQEEADANANANNQLPEGAEDLANLDNEISDTDFDPAHDDEYDEYGYDSYDSTPSRSPLPHRAFSPNGHAERIRNYEHATLMSQFDDDIMLSSDNFNAESDDDDADYRIPKRPRLNGPDEDPKNPTS